MAKITACSDSSPLKKYKTSYPVAFPLSYFEDFILDERPQQMELVVSWLSIFYIKRWQKGMYVYILFNSY